MMMLTLTFRPKFLLRPKIKELTKYHTYTQNDGTKKQIKEKYKTMISPSYITNVKKTGWLVTLFIKKLRKKLDKKGITFSYFGVGEHGTQNTHRAHWHIIFFGIDKETVNAVNIGKSKKNKEIYYSKLINDLWSYEKLGIGQHTISDVTSHTIKYVANYTMKKMYKNAETETKYPTIIRFSNQQKIGLKWARRYHKELRKGYLIDNDGIKYGIPKSYYNEMKRYENLLSNESMNQTAQIIELNKDMQFNKLKELGLLSNEELTKKAKKLENQYKNYERDTF